MRSATSANGRTAQAAADGGQSAALTTSYNGGAVMGLAVGGLGLAGISLMFYLTETEFLTVENIAGFGMGASSIALFARVGGGIYTKAADVGADLGVRKLRLTATHAFDRLLHLDAGRLVVEDLGEGALLGGT